MKIRENFFVLDCYFFVVDILIFDVSSLALHLSVSETSLNQESFEPGSVDCLLFSTSAFQKNRSSLCEKLAYFMVIKLNPSQKF